ncbi:sigma factor-like helix-turn-helix DNA-binding protein [Nonomuraea aurantiaca]|uniref:sigma factor-like helix-turn-helix DNA-binding protein n=1 Tax=Nonomuraea aurantiaca TaxID=2878562 RepID=UPI0027E19337|nr:sigma factor-like helix-turn-helix DNA-binding protein [Nonomuraea aurantiaca]
MTQHWLQRLQTSPESGGQALPRVAHAAVPSALTPASAVALTLRAIGGLTTRQIARAYLMPEATIAQRISRAKRDTRLIAEGVDVLQARPRPPGRVPGPSRRRRTDASTAEETGWVQIVEWYDETGAPH